MGRTRGRKTADTLIKGSGTRTGGDSGGGGSGGSGGSGGWVRPPSAELVDQGEIGTGGSSSVHRALDPKLRRQIAVKTLAPDLSQQPRAIERLVHEAQLTARLEHPNIVPVHDLAINYGDRVYFTMRLIEGRTLSDMIDELGAELDDTGRLHDLLGVFLKVCDAVAFAHNRGIVHCDIKPENIMVGDYGAVYLMDWGVAAITKTLSDPALPPVVGAGRRRSGVRGTPEYMAPEQAEGRAQELDERTDVFGLGAVLYRILTGKPPYEGSTTEAIAKARRCAFVSPLEMPGWSLPKGIVRILLRAMAAKPDDRYPSAKDLRKDVDDFLRGGWHLPIKLFPAGTTIVEEGAWGDAAYIIVKGACEVTKRIAGTPSVLRRLGAGDVFGETAILSGNVRTASVRAIEDTTVRVVTRELLQQELGLDSWLGKFVLALADRFRELDRKLGDGPPPDAT
jgi:serine/threonine-protein kinase